MSITSTPITIGLPQSLLTATSNVAITTVYLCNKSVTTITANIFLTPGTGNVYGNNMIYSNLSIASNDTYVLEHERLLLSPGDAITANIGPDASVNNLLVATISYTSI
jgi:hypothetical protein